MRLVESLLYLNEHIILNLSNILFCVSSTSPLISAEYSGI